MHKSLPLVICMAIVLVGLGGCNVDTVSPTPLTLPVSPVVPTSTPAATHVPTATPAPTPTLTPTPAPTTTPTPTPGDMLTEEERQRLYESSLKYVALTHREAISVARGLRFLTDEGHPSNMCGPLAMAILRDAGLVDRSIILHDYWLLDPSEPSDQWLLESTFPRHRYLWYNSPVSIGDFAWSAFPLQAGDLLYLFAGPGTFEHIIVVTRVDEMGRLYSVSNVNTTEGFIIREVMLYDPNQPGVGQFYEWTNPDNISMGLTGRGGFLLWRRMGRLQEETSKMSAQLDVELDDLLTVRGGHWNVAIKDTDGDLLYHRGAEEILTTPSVVGIPTAMLLFSALDQRGVSDYDVYLASNDLHGNTFQHLLEAMLVDASPSATQDLARWVREQVDEEIILRDWGLYQTTLMPHQSTARGLALSNVLLRYRQGQATRRSREPGRHLCDRDLCISPALRRTRGKCRGPPANHPRYPAHVRGCPPCPLSYLLAPPKKVSVHPKTRFARRHP
jgi:hypothetical protein